jgi:hypothetical protein
METLTTPKHDKIFVNRRGRREAAKSGRAQAKSGRAPALSRADALARIGWRADKPETLAQANLLLPLCDAPFLSLTRPRRRRRVFNVN